MPKRRAEAYIGGKMLKPESLMMTYGHDPFLSEGAVKCPVYESSTYVARSAEDLERFFRIIHCSGQHKAGKQSVNIYGRLNHPNLEIFEDRLTLWDDAEACAGFGSGMAAISTALFGFLKPGDFLLYSEPLYGGTDYLIKNELARFGVNAVGFPATSSRADIEKIILSNKAKKKLRMVFIETPANPTNELVDIEMSADLAKQYSSREQRVLTCVDNTFLGPLWQHPLEHGADIVLYSATKYIGGHSDLIAGAALGSAELIGRLKALRITLGDMPDPATCSRLLRSLETLKLRMTCQMKNAGYVADFLKNHPKVERVYYPAHLAKDSPQYEIYKKQCLSAGAMISFDIKGGKKAAFRFLNSMKLVKLAVSLGGTESLAQHPATATHSGIDSKERIRLGITNKMIRFSVGVENYEDQILDIAQSLEAV